MQIQKRDGRKEPIKLDKISKRIQQMSYKLHKNVDPIKVAIKTIDGIYDGVTSIELDNLASEIAASMSTIHPDYSILAARIAVSSLHKDTSDSFVDTIKMMYNYYINPRNNQHSPLITSELYDIVRNNAEFFESNIITKNDFNYDYFGFRTLERSYLFKCNGKIVERPQYMLMRVSIGIHGNDLDEVIKTYQMMSNKIATHATPTLFNAGTPRPQLSSCFLLDMKDDSIDGIYDTLKQTALISQSAGGIGIAVHKVRAAGSYIAGTNGTSNGLVPMLRVFNDTARYVDQCFLEDALIHTENGHVQMNQLEIGDKIMTHDGTFQTLEKIKSFDKSGYLKINDVEVTHEHLFAVCTNYHENADLSSLNIEWKMAKDLSETDFLISL